MRPSSARRVILSGAFAAWNRTKALFFLFTAVSLIGNFITLLSLLRLDALSSCRSLYYNILPELWRILCILLHPPYLYILLNFILIMVVMKSGVLTRREDENIPQVFPSKMHRILSWKASLYDLDVERSGDSNHVKPEEISAGQKLQSLFMIEPLQTDQDVVSHSAPRDLEEQDNYLLCHPFLSTSVKEQHMIVYDQEPTTSCLQVEARVVLIEDSNAISGRPGQQLVQIAQVSSWSQIADEEMSTEELNRRAEAFIQKVRKSWQRQDSFNQLYGLISVDTKLR